MTARVNLLPAGFVRRRRECRRRQMWISVCLLVVGAQVVAFLLMSGRVREVERQRSQAARLAKLLVQEKADRNAMQAEAASAAREVRAAERLREKHYWSRWLGSLGLVVPEHVVLVGVQTDPVKHVENPVLATKVVAGGPASPAAASGVTAVRLNGVAVEHKDLLALLEAINRTGMFRSVRLEEARRGEAGRQDGISFRVTCEW